MREEDEIDNEVEIEGEMEARSIDIEDYTEVAEKYFKPLKPRKIDVYIFKGSDGTYEVRYIDPPLVIIMNEWGTEEIIRTHISTLASIVIEGYRHYASLYGCDECLKEIDEIEKKIKMVARKIAEKINEEIKEKELSNYK